MSLDDTPAAAAAAAAIAKHGKTQVVSALNHVPPIDCLRNDTNRWTQAPLRYTTPLYLGTLSTTMTKARHDLSCPVVRVKNQLVGGTVGGDVLVWDLDQVMQQDMCSTSIPQHSLQMPSRVYSPPPRTKGRITQLIVLEEGSSTRIVALCATGQVHILKWDGKDQGTKSVFTLSWQSPHPITKGVTIAGEGSSLLLLLAYQSAIRAYDIVQQQAVLRWTMHAAPCAIHDMVALGTQLLAVVMSSGMVQVVQVPTIEQKKPSELQMEDHLVLADPGREIVYPKRSSGRHHHYNSTTSVTWQLNSTSSAIGLGNGIVVVLETNNDNTQWGVSNTFLDQLQLCYGCFGLGSLSTDESLVTCLRAGTTYILSSNGSGGSTTSCEAFGIPHHSNDLILLEGFTCWMEDNDPIFVYQWPMNVIDIYSVAIGNSSNAIVEALVSNGVADDLKEWVIQQKEELHDDSVLAAYKELKENGTTVPNGDSSISITNLQKMPRFRSLLLSLTSD